jgi:putative protease
VTTLTDRRKAAFPVRNECAFCYNTIYNSVPLELISLSQELLKLPLRSLRLSFTTESGLQTEQLLRAAGEILGPFLTDAGEAGEKAAVSGSGAIGHRRLPEQITRGHYRKGVE